jgi:hypothetical protein
MAYSLCTTMPEVQEAFLVLVVICIMSQDNLKHLISWHKANKNLIKVISSLNVDIENAMPSQS